MSGLFDALSGGDIAPPTLANRPTTYNPSNYSSIVNTGNYAALNQGNAAQNGQAAGNGANLASQYGTTAQPQGYNQEYAMSQQKGAIQPFDQSQMLGQYQQGIKNAEQQDVWNRQIYNSQVQNQQFQNNQAGQILGTGLGAAMKLGAGGAFNSNSQAPQTGTYSADNTYGPQNNPALYNQASSLRTQTPYGPINNPYSQGW